MAIHGADAIADALAALLSDIAEAAAVPTQEVEVGRTNGVWFVGINLGNLHGQRYPDRHVRGLGDTLSEAIDDAIVDAQRWREFEASEREVKRKRRIAKRVAAGLEEA